MCRLCRVFRKCHVQVYGYHDCAMDILTCVTELFANKHAGAGDNSGRTLLPSIFDQRRYQPQSPPSVDLSTWPRRHNTRRPPVKPASLPSLPSLQLSDNGRRRNKKRHKRWANSRSTTATSDADTEFSDATSVNFTQ